MIIKQHNFFDMESKRLQALNSYDILDTIPEKEYDAITRLASYICQAPIALVTLIDAERQWVKSKVGIDVDETPRDEAFCNYTIQGDEILEIPDTYQSDLVRTHKSVLNTPSVRFYAGAPLIDPDGLRLGSLCVVDMVPRKLTDEQLDALKTLAGEVMSHLILRKQKKALEDNLATHHEFYNLFDSSHEIHCITDRDFKIEIISKAVTTILGYSPAELTGKPIWDFFTEESKTDSLAILRKGLQTQKRTFEIETAITAKSGGVKCMSWSLDFNNNKWYASGRDISHQKEIAAELEQLSLVASKIDNGVVISSADDKVLWTNEAFERITGYAFEDVESRNLADVLKGKLSKDFPEAKLIELIKTNQPYEVDLLITHKGGRPMWISVIKSVLRDKDGGVTRQIRIVTDITARKKAEQDLEILSFAARKSPTGMLIRDKDGNVVWMNDALEKIFGYSLEEMKGNKFGSVLHGEDTDMAVINKAIEAVKKNEHYEVEVKIYPKNGAPLWVFISNSPFYNESGDVEYQVGVAVDITERKKAQENLTMLSLVASSTTSGVVINDKHGAVQWVSNAFEKITGYSLQDTLNKPLGDVLKGEMTDASVIERTRELSRNKKSFEVDLLAYRKDGKPIWLSIINSVILNSHNEVDKYIEVVIDITDKKKAELELLAAKEEALQLSRAKDMFISVMSHEIRTPLNAVIGMSHLLQESNPLESQKENLGILKFSAENLMHLINDVLDFTKIETGNIELEATDMSLRELLEGVTSSMKYKLGKKDIFLKYNFDDSIPQILIGDRTRICQILLNLVGNSVKFTEKGGITIDVKVVEQTNSEVSIRFAVTDTGIGIAHNKIDTIFESFKQAEADTTRKYGGTGLGLAITKRLIELHNSVIHVDSVPGQGSTFWFIIKFTKGHTNTSAININNIVETELQLNVLVVDDNQINRLLINKVLSKWGVHADFAENGVEAVNKIENNHHYDVVLMDIHMPEMGGIEATQIVRSKHGPYFKHLPIVALTASLMNNEIEAISNSGMNDYILKPFEPKGLYDKLSKYQKGLEV